MIKKICRTNLKKIRATTTNVQKVRCKKVDQKLQKNSDSICLQ